MTAPIVAGASKDGKPVFAIPTPLPKAVGYTVMRAGRGIDARACLLVPHVSAARSMRFNPSARELEVDVAGARIVLGELPADIGALIERNPSAVLLVSVDTLSRARFSSSVGELLASRH
jgi:hypothetical protein